MNIKNLFTKKTILIGVLALTITTIVLIFAFSGKPSEDLIKAVDTAWNATKTQDQPAYLSKVDELSSYKLNSVEVEDDTYTITAIITAPDLGGQLSQLDYSNFPQTEQAEEIDTFLCQQIEKAQITKTDALIYAYKINGEYHITFSDEFVDAMSGNVYKYCQTAYIELMQQYEEGN